MRPGDRLSRLDGGESTLVALRGNDGRSTVYNFTVDQDHTYFVGTGGIWVHNSYGLFGLIHRAIESVVNVVEAGVGVVKGLVTGDYSYATKHWEQAGAAWTGASVTTATSATSGQAGDIVVTARRQPTDNPHPTDWSRWSGVYMLIATES